MTEPVPEFRVAYADSDGEIVGLQPEGVVGAGYSIANLSATEYDKIMSYSTAYLAADGETVTDTPRS